MAHEKKDERTVADLFRACGLEPDTTLLFDAAVDITNLQELLGHDITTAQIYDKRRRTTSESACHDIPI